jgi:hypothetical protein
MHDWWRRVGRDWLDVLQRKRLVRLRPESLRPSLGTQAPRCWARTILNRLRPVPPDVHNFNHSAFVGFGTAAPWRSENVAFFVGQGPELLPFPGREYAICF